MKLAYRIARTASWLRSKVMVLEAESLACSDLGVVEGVAGWQVLLFVPRYRVRVSRGAAYECSERSMLYCFSFSEDTS